MTSQSWLVVPCAMLHSVWYIRPVPVATKQSCRTVSQYIRGTMHFTSLLVIAVCGILGSRATSVPNRSNTRGIDSMDTNAINIEAQEGQEDTSDLENMAYDFQEEPLLPEFTPVSTQTSFRYQNPFDAPLKMACRSGRGAIKRIISIHDNRREDRRWAFLCGHVINPAHCFQCRRTNPVNVYRGPLMFNCPPNQVLSGVESIHSNAKEDRIWRFVCCESYKHVTTKCELTGFINHECGKIDYVARGTKVIVGLHSFYNPKKRDRRWKLMICHYGPDNENCPTSPAPEN